MVGLLLNLFKCEINFLTLYNFVILAQNSYTRLKEFNVGLTNTSLSGAGVNGSYSLCDYYPCPVAEAAWASIYCLPTTLPGRYLFIQHNVIVEYLTLCEVEVYA